MVSTNIPMSELEELLASDLGRKLSDSFDRQILIDLKYIDYEKINVPGWVYDNNVINDWVNETLPDCAFINSTFYYKAEADATLFRLKWL